MITSSHRTIHSIRVGKSITLYIARGLYEIDRIVVNTQRHDKQLSKYIFDFFIRLQLQKVERLGEEAWAGVAAVDKGSKDAETSYL